jgi:hypothetical protein
MKVFIATLETRHYSFAGYGENETQAENALLESLNAHAMQCRPPLQNTWGAAMIGDANVREVETGVGYRDYTELARIT